MNDKDSQLMKDPVDYPHQDYMFRVDHYKVGETHHVELLKRQGENDLRCLKEIEMNDREYTLFRFGLTSQENFSFDEQSAEIQFDVMVRISRKMAPTKAYEKLLGID